ncbi:MAG TPA: hypothetical protein VK308_04585, partial [Pyrinomonadaceae bacterium]|nr:hypothetical protein [Pyrinomonadaceae bacterium]
MPSTTDLKRELLRHLIATVAFRGGIAVANAPMNFAEFRVGETTRSAGEILAHLGDLIEGSLFLMKGEFVYLHSPAQLWAQDVERFFAAIEKFDLYLASDAPLAHPIERIVQGPVADALTHVGQIVLLRRLAGKPVRAEGYFAAEI